MLLVGCITIIYVGSTMYQSNGAFKSEELAEQNAAQIAIQYMTKVNKDIMNIGGFRKQFRKQVSENTKSIVHVGSIPVKRSISEPCGTPKGRYIFYFIYQNSC